MFTRLKQKWNIKSNLEFTVIMIVFAVTGSSTLYVRKEIFYILGITPETELLLRILLYIVIIFPVYNLMFLAVAFIFGQFRFALEFEKKMLSRLKWKSK